MHTTFDADNNTVEHYDNITDYSRRGVELQRTGGRRQYIYEGWLNGELVRIIRR
ncbi:unnamed protein product [marine sediment metagenome]|uniref:Uncharacterized protein n=1 Tax=marine sediment metagenome TaxID=412755 RepID=X0S9W5_9ZZZZ